MTDHRPLSPAAQAVLHAAHNAPDGRDSHRNAAAAALRAAADVIAPTQEDRAELPEMHSQIFLNGVAYAVMEFRAIAAELEGQR